LRGFFFGEDMMKEPVGTKVFQLVRDAVDDYSMIQAGDKVLLALSGGKDSLTLLTVLKELREARGNDFELGAIHVETDASCGVGVFGSLLKGLCEENGIPIKYRYFPIIEDAGEKLSCFYCAIRRRASMFNYAVNAGYTTLAFGHHLSDMAETLLMNMSFHGNISTMTPTTSFFDGKLRVIRPLVYVHEEDTREFIADIGMGTAVCQCPFSSENIRSKFKTLLETLETENPGVRRRLFDAMQSLGGKSPA
jgi:tRNA 2-thiocytidine biosynthesis protein TtcA